MQISRIDIDVAHCLSMRCSLHPLALVWFSFMQKSLDSSYGQYEADHAKQTSKAIAHPENIRVLVVSFGSQDLRIMHV